MIRALKSRNISTFEDITVHVHGDHHHQQLPHYEAGKVNQSCFNSQNPVTSNHEKSSYSSTVSQYDCQLRGREFENMFRRCEDQGCWLVSVYMWTQLTEGNCYGCIHFDPAHLQHHHPTPAAQFCVLFILYHHQGQK